MSNTRVRFVGGTGLISSACVREAVRQGMEVTLLNRGSAGTRSVPSNVEILHADVRSKASVRAALGERTFDVIAQFVGFTRGHVETDIELFTGRCGQYLFISTAAAYETPPSRLPIRESTPLRNGFWKYAQDKIECETALVAAWRETGFPVTIVRPSHTYDRRQVPTTGGWTDLARMRRGAPVLVHGDGTTQWTITHSSDFARGFTGLIGRPELVGDCFHITSDEAPTWNQIYTWLGRAVGVEPTLVHVASDTIARVVPELAPGILGDKVNCAVFDNTKIKGAVPNYRAEVPFIRGAAEIVAWYMESAGRQVVDDRLDAAFDRLVGVAAAF